MTDLDSEGGGGGSAVVTQRGMKRKAAESRKSRDGVEHSVKKRPPLAERRTEADGSLDGRDNYKRGKMSNNKFIG